MKVFLFFILATVFLASSATCMPGRRSILNNEWNVASGKVFDQKGHVVQEKNRIHFNPFLVKKRPVDNEIVSESTDEAGVNEQQQQQQQKEQNGVENAVTAAESPLSKRNPGSASKEGEKWKPLAHYRFLLKRLQFILQKM
ncbi:hypothetical protein TYRP_022114 [Tyrophagus putrescentiae]|nr:hypothetical protein TYRP_022114 [Tyrophagus putrescentiae]